MNLKKQTFLWTAVFAGQGLYKTAVNVKMITPHSSSGFEY